MKCPNCNAEVVGRFCSYCGSELPKKEPNIHIEHNETIYNNYGNQNSEENIFDFACTELDMGNYQNAYDLFGKVLMINSKNMIALFFREICDYYMTGNIYNTKKIFFKIINEDYNKESLNKCLNRFSDVLITYSDDSCLTDDFEEIKELSKYMKSIEKEKYSSLIRDLKESVRVFKYGNFWGLNIFERITIKKIIEYYDEELRLS